MRVAIYLRVSTDGQETDNQKLALLKLAETRGYDVTEIYQENESAWTDGHQREFARLLNDASYHKFDILLVWALDRISRLGIARILSVVDTLHNYKIKIISHEEAWTESPNEMTQMFYAMTAWAAKYDSDRKSARIKAANDRRRAKGLPVGRLKGARDRKPRKRTGYFLRYADRRVNKLSVKKGTNPVSIAV